MKKAKKVLTIHVYKNDEILGVRVHRESDVSDTVLHETMEKFALTMYTKAKGKWNEKHNYHEFKNESLTKKS